MKRTAIVNEEATKKFHEKHGEKSKKNMRYFMIPTGVIHLLLKGLYMAGKRTSDIAKRYLDSAEKDMLKLQQQLNEATLTYEARKYAYHHALACEKTPFK